jgi:mRNA-decapping enzyme subunit 2
VNEGETPHNCAIREVSNKCTGYNYDQLLLLQVLEETGFDIADLIDLNEYIDFKMHEQLTRLYLVPNIPMDTTFQPRTRNEIKVR